MLRNLNNATTKEVTEAKIYFAAFCDSMSILLNNAEGASSRNIILLLHIQSVFTTLYRAKFNSSSHVVGGWNKKRAVKTARVKMWKFWKLLSDCKTALKSLECTMMTQRQIMRVIQGIEDGLLFKGKLDGNWRSEQFSDANRDYLWGLLSKVA